MRWWTWGGARANAVLVAALDAVEPELLGDSVAYDNWQIGLRSDVTAAQITGAKARLHERFGQEFDGVVPLVDERAVQKLKFSEMLPPDVAVATLAARGADRPGTSPHLEKADLGWFTLTADPEQHGPDRRLVESGVTLLCYVARVNEEMVMAQLRQYVAERDWSQFHSPGNLSKSISIEAGELLEHFQWDDEDIDTAAVAGELADVLTYSYLLADRLGLDPHAIMLAKLEQTRAKYPVDKASGVSTKYDRL